MNYVIYNPTTGQHSNLLTKQEAKQYYQELVDGYIQEYFSEPTLIAIMTERISMNQVEINADGNEVWSDFSAESLNAD